MRVLDGRSRSFVVFYTFPCVSSVCAGKVNRGEVTADKETHFSFAGVKPREYRLFCMAWCRCDRISHIDPVSLRKYKTDSAEVRVDQDDIGVCD